VGGQQHLLTHSTPSHRLSRSSSRILTRNHQAYSEYSVLIIGGAKHLLEPLFQIVGLSLMSRRFRYPTKTAGAPKSDKRTTLDSLDHSYIHSRPCASEPRAGCEQLPTAPFLLHTLFDSRILTADEGNAKGAAKGAARPWVGPLYLIYIWRGNPFVVRTK
jgi:hypothetical protein